MWKFHKLDGWFEGINSGNVPGGSRPLVPTLKKVCSSSTATPQWAGFQLVVGDAPRTVDGSEWDPTTLNPAVAQGKSIYLVGAGYRVWQGWGQRVVWGAMVSPGADDVPMVVWMTGDQLRGMLDLLQRPLDAGGVSQRTDRRMVADLRARYEHLYRTGATMEKEVRAVEFEMMDIGRAVGAAEVLQWFTDPPQQATAIAA